MKTKKIKFITMLPALFLLTAATWAQTTAFNYQGKLNDGVSPANGNYQLQFRLFDAVSGGTQIGSTITDVAAVVNQGIFSVRLDFGASVFTGANRFLEIAVRRNSGESYVTLSPREQIASSPYSIRTLSAASADVAANAANADNLSAACVGCVTNNHINSVEGAKVTGTVANATNAVNATNAANATNANNATNAVNATNAANFTGNLTGDVTGTQGATTVARIQSRNVAGTAPLGGQVLKYNSLTAQWEPDTDNISTGGGGTITGVTPGTGLSGGGASGNVTLNIANGGVGTAQLADNSVTDGKINSVSGGKVTGAVANATNAVNATNAINAVNANNATNATNATNAVNATNATNATTAVNFSGTLSGDVTGNQTATTVARLRDVSLPAPVVADNGRVLKYKNNGVDPITLEWANDNTAAGGGGVTTVTASGPLASSGGATPNISLTGVVPAANGGTGVSAAGAVGNVLRSNGTAWTSGALQAADVPAGSGNYIQNATTPQAGGDFNISGTGTANILNATTQYNIGGSRILSNAGTRNVFAGVGAGQANVSGLDNAFFGFNAGLSNNTGVRNTYAGVGAGQANVNGHDSTFYGFNAGLSNTGTGGANAVANFNSFFGANAGRSVTTGGFNSFFGADAGSGSTTGNTNSFFGVNAGSGNAGDDNSFFGAVAGVINNGNRNSFFGRSTGRQPLFGDPTLSATGDDNSFFGNSAGSRNLASSNSFFGSGAGAANTEGNSNSFVGMGAGNSNTTGGGNSFVGTNAGRNNTFGAVNSFFGERAGRSNMLGGGNSFVGSEAGFNNTAGSLNSFVGWRAGLFNATGNSNTIIGAEANVGSGNLFFATAIGAGSRVDASNTMVLGLNSGAGTNVVIGANGEASGFNSTRGARLNVFGNAIGPFWTSNNWISGIQVQTAAAIGWNGVGNAYAFGIGQTTGGLYFFRTASFMGETISPAIYDFQIDNNGLARFYRNCVANAAGAAIAGTCSSDVRLKRDITSFSRMLDKVAQLRPVNFYWRREEFPERAFGEEQSFGLVAQEAEKILPELVGEDADGFKTVNYTKLPLLLLQAIKDLKSENDELKQQNAATAARLAAQQKLIDGLKKLVCTQNPQANVCRKEQK